MGDEIFDYGPGRGYPWLREHLVSGYRPQWYQHSDDTTVDASILTAPGESRWINYYIEGLGWLVPNNNRSIGRQTGKIKIRYAIHDQYHRALPVREKYVTYSFFFSALKDMVPSE
jgi:hypothetical protein